MLHRLALGGRSQPFWAKSDIREGYPALSGHHSEAFLAVFMPLRSPPHEKRCLPWGVPAQ